MVKLILVILLFISGNISAADFDNENIPKKRKSSLEDVNNNFKKKRITIVPCEEIQTIDDLSADDMMACEGTTIVCWDIDETILRKKLLISNLPKSDRNKLIDSALEDENKNHVKKFKNYLKTDSRFRERTIMDETNQKRMQELQERGAIEIALTARKKSCADRTYKSLNDMGIDFTKLSNLEDYQFDATNEAIFRQGIFYTGNSQDKVQFVPIIVNNISKKLNKKGPFTVYHIDDKEREIDAFENCDLDCSEVNDDITIRPIYYRAHDNFLDDACDDMDEVTDHIMELYDEYLEQQ